MLAKVCHLGIGNVKSVIMILLKNLVSTCLGYVIEMTRLFCMSVSKCLSLTSIELSSYRDVLFPDRIILGSNILKPSKCFFKLVFVFKDKFYFEHDLDLEIVKVNLTTSRSMCRVQKVNCFHFYQLWYGP